MNVHFIRFRRQIRTVSVRARTECESMFRLREIGASSYVMRLLFLYTQYICAIQLRVASFGAMECPCFVSAITDSIFIRSRAQKPHNSEKCAATIQCSGFSVQ